MRFSLKASDLARDLAGTEGAIARSVTAAMRQVTEGLKSDLRADVVESGLGQRLANTWRGKTFPESGASIGAAAFVWSKAPSIVDAFDRGVTIRSSRGFWLAIPTPAAGKTGLSSTGARKRITPGGWERRTGMRLRLVYRRGRPSLLVADEARMTRRGLAVKSRSKSGRGQVTAIIFLLVPQVTLRKRLDIEASASRWAARVPGLITQHWR
ncbi:MAG TPA: DUF6441 family protein [Xanthobacteraceae bacterium]|nr:DUF6441 family protein [Xanthobacteraceae bacterium]